MKIVVAGASGFIGRALVPAMRADGHDVRRLVRTPAAGADDAIHWDPSSLHLDPAIDGADVIINLAGENIAGGRWTKRRRLRIRSSRVMATRTLVEAVARQSHRPTLFVNASAVGIYGERGSEELSEDSIAGQGFLAEVCRDWEAVVRPVEQLGIRVVMLRFGVVLGPSGGALAKMLPIFRFGLGGRLGSGRQWMSWVSRDDVIEIVRFVIASEVCRGAINVVAPTPVTNADFSAELGRVLRRPAILPVPAWVLRTAFGEMADETLLSSTRAIPARLSEWGYRFRHPTLRDALAASVR